MKKELNEMTVSELRSLQVEIMDEIKSRKNTLTGAVLFIIHVGNYEEVAKLFITHLPQGTSSGELKNLIDDAGYWFGEFGSKWANHAVVVGLGDQRSDVRAAYKSGMVKTITYDELLKKVNELETVN